MASLLAMSLGVERLRILIDFVPAAIVIGIFGTCVYEHAQFSKGQTNEDIKDPNLASKWQALC